MLIIEIALVFAAWGRGWKGYALLPLAIAFGIGLMLGAEIIEVGSIETAAIVLDATAIGVLLLMVIFKRGGKEEEKSLEPKVEVDTEDKSKNEPFKGDLTT